MTQKSNRKLNIKLQNDTIFNAQEKRWITFIPLTPSGGCDDVLMFATSFHSSCFAVSVATPKSLCFC